MKSFELEYRNMKCSDMSNEEIEETSRLFSEHYGMWSEKSPIHPGKSIRMSPRKIQKDFVDKPDRYVALVYHHNKLVGHIFYLRRKMKNKRYITWILQLVVNKEYRGHQIGTKLMHSIFQLSDSYAWGLYTSNPMTIKTLENATMRKIEIKTIEKI